MRKLLSMLITLTVLVGSLLGSLSFTMLTVNAEPEPETTYSAVGARGVWHRPNASGRETTLDGMRSVLDEMAATGINMIFLETFYHGMTVYKTNLVPYYTGFDKFDYGEYPDYLTAFATEAEKRGIEVHAWVETFYLGVSEDTPLVKYFPHWLLVNEKGSIRHTTEGANLGGYIFLDPANPDACDYLLRFYDELLTRIPAVRGLNIDYIRYPVSDFSAGTDTGYTDAAMTAFAEKHGLTIGENNRIADFKSQLRAASLVDEWTAYRADLVTSFVGRVHEMVVEGHPDSIISVAVHPDESNAYYTKKQDFTTWVKRGYIDVVTPMVYYYNASQISSAVREMTAKFEGVYCYAGLYTTYHNQSTDELSAHIDAALTGGADGFILFESVKTFFNPATDYYGYLSSNHGAPAALPHLDTARLIGATADVISATLAENGISDEMSAPILDELSRIAKIGEGSATALAEVLTALATLRDGIASDLAASAAPVCDTLDTLIAHLEVREARLAVRGYPDAPNENPDGTDDPTDNPTENPDNDPDGGNPAPDNDPTPDEPRGFFDILRSFFERIINWFRDLFSAKDE